MNEAELRSIAANFWKLAGDPADFPRDLEASVLWALPLGVVKLPRLRSDLVRDWLAVDGLADLVPPTKRDLRACVVASRGRGLVFIDGADPIDEQRMSLAHEVAHFLLDYLLPRQAAMKVFGDAIVPVLDGDRVASPQERFSAMLRGVRVGVYSRLWHRGPSGLAEDAETVAREDSADALALELVAPRREVIARTRAVGVGADTVSRVLTGEFGLPTSVAEGYARVICVAARPTPSMKEWLGLESS